MTRQAVYLLILLMPSPRLELWALTSYKDPWTLRNYLFPLNRKADIKRQAKPLKINLYPSIANYYITHYISNCDMSRNSESGQSGHTENVYLITPSQDLGIFGIDIFR